MPNECAAVGCSEKLTKEFSFHAFSTKNETRKRQWQVAMNRWDLATKKWEQNITMCSAQSISKKMLHRSHTAEHSVWAQIHVCRGVPRVTDSEQFPVRISKDEAPTALPVVGPLFISSLSFQLSRALFADCVSIFFVVLILAFTTG